MFTYYPSGEQLFITECRFAFKSYFPNINIVNAPFTEAVKIQYRNLPEEIRAIYEEKSNILRMKIMVEIESQKHLLKVQKSSVQKGRVKVAKRAPKKGPLIRRKPNAKKN